MTFKSDPIGIERAVEKHMALIAEHEAKQLTIDGREEASPETHERDIARDPEAPPEPLFDFPTTMRGQTALDTDGGTP